MSKNLKFFSNNIDKIQHYFKYTTFTILGYNDKARSHALNLKDNGLNVIIGTTKPNNLAIKDGFITNINLYGLDTATIKGDIIMNLLSEEDQKQTWNKYILPYLDKNKTLYFGNGFNIVFRDHTKINPPKNIDVIMVAPQCSDKMVRSLYLENGLIKSNIAIYQDYSGYAEQNAIYIGYAIGSKKLYKTTFINEVYNNLINDLKKIN